MAENIIESFHIDANSSLPAALNYWEIFLRDQGKSEFTIKAFLGDLRLLQKFLPTDISIGKVVLNDLNRFVDWVENGRGKGIPCTPKSLMRRITSLKSFFRWLASNGRIAVDPAEPLVQHTVISPLPQVLTKQEESKAIQAAFELTHLQNPDWRPYVLLKLLLETGIKKSECLKIKPSHFFIEGDEKYLFVRYSDQKDRNKERKISISSEWVNAYQNFLRQYPPADTVFPWSPRLLEYILEDIGKAANLQKHVSFTMCRWNAALSDIHKGKDPEYIRQKLGVSKIQWRELKAKLQKLELSV
jgi:integrase/recombinase XerD